MATIEQFQEIKGSRKTSYGEEGKITYSRVFLCPRATVESHRPKIGDDYGLAPAIQGGARIAEHSDAKCTSVDVEGYGGTDTGTSGTVKITAQYRTRYSEGSSSDVDNVTTVEYDTSVEFDILAKDIKGAKVKSKVHRRPKVVVRITQRRRTKVSLADMKATIGGINATRFLGGKAHTILLDRMSIVKEGRYWVHSFDFVYYHKKLESGVEENWDSVNVENQCLLPVNMDVLGIVEGDLD